MNGRSLVLIVALLAAACADREPDGTNGSVGAVSLFDPLAANPSLCGSPAIPFPNNALFSSTTDGTLNIPNPASAPFVTAANLTDGFSTTASIFTDVLGAVDYATAGDAVLIFEADASPRFLVAGADFRAEPSIAMSQVSGTGNAAGSCLSTGIPAKFLPISQQRSRLLIEPLKPLNPSTTYIVAVTKSLKSVEGIAAKENEFFRVVNSDTKLCDLDNTDPSPALLDCTDPAAPAAAAAASNEAVLKVIFAGAPSTAKTTRIVTLETLRKRLIRPTVSGLKAGYSALKGGAVLNDSDLVIAWSFTTQSTAITLSRLDTRSAINVANTTISTGDLGLGLADTADIWAGTVAVPYYQTNSGGNVNSTAPLTGFWASTATLNAVNPPGLGGAVPCGALAKSASTTICYPDPATVSTETVPVLVAVPNANSGRVKPANGWPVAVFQHGVTRSRTDMLAIAPTLAAAGMVVVAMDQPLHGLTNNIAFGSPGFSPFYRNQIFMNPAFGGAFNSLITGERTFDLDLVDNTPDTANPCLAANNQPDNAIDSTGTHYLNLSSLITSRDNLRQSEADLLHLVRSLATLDLDQNSGAATPTDIDETRVGFVGHSLGASVGVTMLANVNNSVLNAASLIAPGGGFGKLLDASAAFGNRVSSGLACSFVFEGTDTYETFIRFAQHLVDPGDPINYAAAANANHPLHVVEILSDATLPNTAGGTCPAAGALPGGLGATATAVDPPGSPVPGVPGAAQAAQAAAAGVAGAALTALCPPLVLPPDPPLAAITHQDETVIAGYLSGTDPLLAAMGLTTSVSMGNAPFSAQTARGADTVVVFAPDTAEHGTVLTPDSSAVAGVDAAFLPATCAMQKQTATFLASNGTVIPVGGSCP